MVIRGRLALAYEAAIVIRIASQTAEPDSETPSQLELNLNLPDGVRRRVASLSAQLKYLGI